MYIGQAAHCSSTGESTSTNGCTSGTLPEGSRVNITGAAFPGKMVYNSWARMQRRGETDENTCAYNDVSGAACRRRRRCVAMADPRMLAPLQLALVLIDPRDVSKVNPTVPYFGGPSGERQGAVSNLEQVVSYGNSILRAGITFLSPKFGTQISSDGDGWSHGVYTVTPGIPGDSGSGFMDNKGAAFGVLSTLQFAPVAGSNGVGDLQKELAYARTFSDFSGITLAKGTAAFRGALNLAGAGDLLKAPSPAIAASKKSVSLRQL